VEGDASVHQPADRPTDRLEQSVYYVCIMYAPLTLLLRFLAWPGVMEVGTKRTQGRRTLCLRDSHPTLVLPKVAERRCMSTFTPTCRVPCAVCRVRGLGWELLCV
jgi:hypothetical protein